MKFQSMLAFLLISVGAQAAELAPPQKALVIKLAGGYNAATVAQAFSEGHPTGIPGLDAILNGWAFKEIQPVFNRNGRTPRNPELFNRLGLNRYLVLGWEPGAMPRPAYILDQIVGQLRQVATVEEAELNAQGTGDMTPNDPEFPDQWHHFAINSTAAWDTVTGTTDVLVAVIDSGICPTNGDLDYALISNYWDYVEDDDAPQDEVGHGTHVAGIIGAQANNANLVAGLAWNCRILNCRVLDESGSGYYSDFAAAMVDAADVGARVLNLSLGGDTPSSILSNACDYAYGLDCTIVVSMGNEDWSLAHYPAAYDKVIAVGATGEDDARVTGGSWGSNYGANIDVVAPGEDILSTIWDTTEAWSGTSMATPMVSALAALMLQVHPALSNEGVKILIEVTSADEVGDPAEDIPGFDNYMGYGRIQYEQAVSMAVFASTCTLACVAATESPTPIALLKPFYGLRDGKLRSTAIGRKLIADYYAATVGVAPVVSKDVKLMFRLLSCVKQYAPLIEQLKARPGAPVVLPRSLWAESCAIANLLLPKLNSGTRERVRPWIERGKRDPIGLLKEMEIPAVMQ